MNSKYLKNWLRYGRFPEIGTECSEFELKKFKRSEKLDAKLEVKTLLKIDKMLNVGNPEVNNSEKPEGK